MCERGPSSARHRLQPSLCHGNRSCGREEHSCIRSLEGNQRDLVSALIGLGEERDGGAFCGVHSVQSHRPRGVDDKNNQTARFACHPLHSHITLFDKDLSLLSGCRQSFSRIVCKSDSSTPLVGCSCSHRGVHRQSLDLSFGEHRLDIPPSVLAEDQTTASRLAFLLFVCEVEKFIIHRCALSIEHELLGDLGLLLLLLLLLILFLLLLVFVLVVLVCVFLVPLGGGRRGRRLLHLRLIHLEERASWCDDEFDC
mmetsp:Transcript_29216/g.57307  ORF Transcript_29216/g.57307 Transcript_29216/m.57307 type:complete len:254 (-) Transcript_29216:1313-2074(-)